jgi:Tfp pilus assembly protein PilE
MKRILWKLRNTRGTSFLEVMVALAITGIITMAIFKTYLTQHKQYLVQDDVAEIQQNVRASIEELARHARMAGYDLPTGMPAIVPSDTDPDTITLNYRTGDCDTYLSNPMPQPSAELKCATDVSCFDDGDWVYIFEPDSGGGEWFEITHVQEAAMHIQHNTMPLSRKYGADAIVIKLNQVKFYVDNTTDPEHPKLMVKIPGEDAHIYADDIYDLQFNYRMKNDSVYADPVLLENVREVLITVSGRSRQQTGNTEVPYRTRTYSTAVALRNIAIE